MNEIAANEELCQLDLRHEQLLDELDSLDQRLEDALRTACKSANSAQLSPEV